MKRFAKRILFLFLISFASFASYQIYQKNNPALKLRLTSTFSFSKKQSVTITTIFGATTITEPVLLDLLQSKAVLRMKHLDQGGVSRYVQHKKLFTRYDHSLGVFYLVRFYGGDLKEQVAALLHDVSHTAFSHVGDFVFRGKDGDRSYQDDIHMWFLSKTDVPEILKKHGFVLNDFANESDFILLEQKLPDVCADRFEYNVRTALCEKLITQKDVDEVLHDLVFENGNWFFRNVDIAKKFANIPFALMKMIWNAPWDYIAYQWSAKAIKLAFKKGILLKDDIHFGVDEGVWNILKNSKDEEIKKCVENILSAPYNFYFSDSSDYDYHCKNKFRGIDPLVKTEDEIKRLTEVDADFEKLYKKEKQIIERGWFLKQIS